MKKGTGHWTLRLGKFLLDLVELYIPMLAFVVLFMLFIVNIFFRYALNNPLTWPLEIIVTGFVWLAILSATYVRRVGGHVKFTLIYERLSAKMQTYNRILVNVIVVVLFAIAVPATWDWVQFMSFKGTTNFHIPFSIVYLPTVPFLVLIIAHSVYEIVVDIRHLAQHQLQKEEEPPEVRT